MPTTFCCTTLSPCKNCISTAAKYIELHKVLNSFLKDNGVKRCAAEGVVDEIDSKYYQVVNKVDFSPEIISNKWYHSDDSNGGILEEVPQKNLPPGLFKENSFMNFRCLRHKRFIEINLYSADHTSSQHHQSTISGHLFTRDAAAIDLSGARGWDKGDRW